MIPPWGERPWIMGVLNATPDSFSGDGLGDDADRVVSRAIAHCAEGAAILDLGGESTRPDAMSVDAAAESARILPALERLAREVRVPISVDTSKAAVADAALRAGARIVNDVSGLRDEGLAAIAARHDAWLVVMDNGWTHPREGRPGPIVHVVCAELRRLVDVAARAGMPHERIVVDPGLGFGKTSDESLALLAATEEIRERMRPHLLLVGPSRKRFTGEALGLAARERLEPTLGAVGIAAFLGADIIRVHDVRESVRAAWLGSAAARAGGRSPRVAYVGLGSNVGNVRENLRRAVRALARIGPIVAVSGLWETAPMMVTDQPRFLNAAVAVELPREPADASVARLKRIEADLGRTAGARFGPREIDLDLLAYAGGEAERSGDVVVPHARLGERRFALGPLAEIAPGLVLADTGRAVADLLEAVTDQDANKVEGAGWWTGSS